MRSSYRTICVASSLEILNVEVSSLDAELGIDASLGTAWAQRPCRPCARCARDRLCVAACVLELLQGLRNVSALVLWKLRCPGEILAWT